MDDGTGAFLIVVALIAFARGAAWYYKRRGNDPRDWS